MELQYGPSNPNLNNFEVKFSLKTLLKLAPKNKKCKETESIPTRKDLKLKSSFSVSVYPYVLCQIKDTAFGKDELKLYVI